MQPSQVSRATSERYETDTNPSSDLWARGNAGLAYASSDYSDRPESTRQSTGTSWDNFPGDTNRLRGPGSTTSKSAGFVKQSAVRKDVNIKVKEQLQRDRARQAQERDEQLTLANSDEGSSDDEEDDPY